MLKKVVFQSLKNIFLIFLPFLLFNSFCMMFWLFVLMLTVAVNIKHLEESPEIRLLVSIGYIGSAFIVWTVPYMFLGVYGIFFSIALLIAWQHLIIRK